MSIIRVQFTDTSLKETDGQQAHEKVFIIIYYQGNANRRKMRQHQEFKEMPTPKRSDVTSVGVGVEKKVCSYTVVM